MNFFQKYRLTRALWELVAVAVMASKLHTLLLHNLVVLYPTLLLSNLFMVICKIQPNLLLLSNLFMLNM